VDQLIEEQASHFSGLLQVHLSRGRIKLSTKNATYSYEEYYSVFEKGFQQLNIEKQAFENALILGFGLGSVPVLLEKVYKMNLNYTGVEIDGVIIELAEKYLNPEILQKVELIESDANEWVNNSTNQKQFDLIIIDLFIDHKTAPLFFETSFIKQVAKHLSKNGLLLFNTLTFKSNRKQIMVYYNQIFKSVFAKAEKLKIGANYLLVGYGS